MTPYQQQLLTGLGISLLLLIIIIGLIFFARSKWVVQKKVIGAVVFILGFISLLVIWVNLAPYFFHNFVIGEVRSVDCSGDIGKYSSRFSFSACDYEITYLLDNKEQNTKINSISNTIYLSQGQQVEVYYKKNNSGLYGIGVGKVGDNKSFLLYLFSHWLIFVFPFLGLMFFYSGFKLMGFISIKTDDTVNKTIKDIL
jgi:hypothetical protein